MTSYWEWIWLEDYEPPSDRDSLAFNRKERRPLEWISQSDRGHPYTLNSSLLDRQRAETLQKSAEEHKANANNLLEKNEITKAELATEESTLQSEREKAIAETIECEISSAMLGSTYLLDFKLMARLLHFYQSIVHFVANVNYDLFLLKGICLFTN